MAREEGREGAQHGREEGWQAGQDNIGRSVSVWERVTLRFRRQGVLQQGAPVSLRRGCVTNFSVLGSRKSAQL